MHDAVDAGGDLLVCRRLTHAREADGAAHFTASGLQHLGEPIENLAAVVAASFRPCRTRFGRRFHGIAQVLARTLRHVGNKATLVIVPGSHATAFRTDERTADITFGSFGDADAGHGSERFEVAREP